MNDFGVNLKDSINNWPCIDDKAQYCLLHKPRHNGLKLIN